MISQTVNELKAISKSKAGRVNAILKNKIEELKILRKSPQIKADLANYSDTSEVSKFSLYRNIIGAKEDMTEISRILILDSSGNLIMSSNPDNTLKTNFSDYDVVKNLHTRNKLTIEYHYNEKGEVVLSMAAYISYNHIIVVENDITSILSITDDYTGLGKTGETALIVMDKDSNVTYLNPVRFHKTPFLKAANEKSDYFLLVTNNNEVDVLRDVTDYRQQKVLASLNNIHKPGWKLITKIDREEALASVNELREITIVAALIITGVMFVLIYLFANYFVKPINELAYAAERISEGNLTQKVNVSSDNELGQLATSFNKMTDHLLSSQKALQENVLELNKSNNALDKFAHIISHDLKAPLNSIEGLTNLMKLEFGRKLTDDEMQLVLKINEQTKQMKKMIKGVLELSELKHENFKEAVDLNYTIKTVLENLNIPTHIKIKIDNTLPVVYMEKILIQQVFQNIISNAIKYIDKTEGVIEIGSVIEGNYNKMFISDNGTGIEENYKQSIFEMYFTGGRDKSYESTGLGLSIVKNIIKESGGEIWVESKKGEGSSFYFTLPIHKESVHV